MRKTMTGEEIYNEIVKLENEVRDYKIMLDLVDNRNLELELIGKKKLELELELELTHERIISGHSYKTIKTLKEQTEGILITMKRRKYESYNLNIF